MAKGDADKILLAIINLAVERFGEKEKKEAKRCNAKNHREVRIHVIRQELKTL